jgi:hypothetical protein
VMRADILLVAGGSPQTRQKAYANAESHVHMGLEYFERGAVNLSPRKEQELVSVDAPDPAAGRKELAKAAACFFLSPSWDPCKEHARRKLCEGWAFL